LFFGSRYAVFLGSTRYRGYVRMGSSASQVSNSVAKLTPKLDPTQKEQNGKATLKPPRPQGDSGVPSGVWTHEAASQLQNAVDRIFAGAGGASLRGLEYSFTIADPFLEGCPLIGCSTGFLKLCGYDLEDIVGRNCRFLISPVPVNDIDQKMRQHTKDFCEAVRLGQTYRRPAEDYESWMPRNRPLDELISMQRNARKDGSLFNNLFYMKVIGLSPKLGEEQPYIVALQSELRNGKESLADIAKNLEDLDERMAKVKQELATHFFMQCSASRTKTPEALLTPRKLEPVSIGNEVAPRCLYEMFPADEVQPWEENRFKNVRKLCDATRNKGVVQLRHDTTRDQFFAVKQMPNSWIRDNHDDFRVAHPSEIEMPWQDIGCTRYLNSVDYKYACSLEGVYRDKENTFVMSAFASGGDLFDLSQSGATPGPTREENFAQLVVDLLSALKQLHSMQIVHRDLSLENVLLTNADVRESEIRIIDFGMSSTMRSFRSVSGKASYQAPEMHTSSEHDAFLTDMFAAGVLIYTLMVKDYPWLSTKYGRCKCFEYVQKYGFRAYCAKRKVRGTDSRISDSLSEPLLQLLEGMMEMDPSKRLTFGEKVWGKERRSVWDEPWIRSVTTKCL